MKKKLIGKVRYIKILQSKMNQSILQKFIIYVYTTEN